MANEKYCEHLDRINYILFTNFTIIDLDASVLKLATGKDVKTALNLKTKNGSMIWASFFKK